MNEDENMNESDRIKMPHNLLFSINSNYNSLEINQMMNSSKNLFSHLSPLFTKTLTSFKNDKNKLSSQNINAYSKKNLVLRNCSQLNNISNPKLLNYNSHKFLKTQNNFKNKHFLLSPNNPPSIQDKNKLTSYYKTSENIKSNYKSPQDKEFKNNLFEKYEIKKNKYSDINYPQITDHNLHLKIMKPYFKNTYKANKTIDINKQLVHRVTEMTNFFLLKKYFQKIEKDQKKMYFIRKMPKIQIKSKIKKFGFKKENEYEEEINNGNNKKK